MQTFAYEITENGARILRCFSCDKRVEIPEQIEGIIVREIGDYAFSVHFDEAAFKLGQARGRVRIAQGSFGRDIPLEGEEVEEVILPPSVERVGAYCFYNCSNLRLLGFTGSVRDWGQGAFTGCHRVRRLDYRLLPGQVSCLKEVLSELREQLLVTYRDEGGYARLLFPEYFEEGVENTPARILMTRVHGSGLYYRNCFDQKNFNFAEYDRRFRDAKPVESSAFLADLALGRRMFPYKLADTARRVYDQYLEERFKPIVQELVRRREEESLKWLAGKWKGRKGETEPKHLEVILEEANRAGMLEMVSFLMELHRRTGRRQRKVFDL